MDWLKNILPLAQTGSAGVALILAFVILKMFLKNSDSMDKMNARYDSITEKNTQSHIQLSGVIASHTAALQSLERTIERKI